ncbi:hypothetical protein FJV46_07390 [Arthrobacter agilis]|uniref:DUF7793 family protein n=1 Tax=Arthrobacter agilis TaxID=37921 RepID=UPI000F71EB81|nr:hypothetical protein [Arthrobacter agilis]TPV25462.1 hypothetical protein FJV46_07390 [Arthrobacter agilis]VDR33204.1 Uncharacterised protein [Arthrobacter agilis]
METVVAASGRATLSVVAPDLHHLVWSPRVHIDRGDALSVLAASRRISRGRPYAILVDMTTTVDLPPRAREVFNGETLVVAAALLGDGPMDEVLAAGACKAVHPTRYFTSAEQACCWLEERLKERRSMPGDDPIR